MLKVFDNTTSGMYFYNHQRFVDWSHRKYRSYEFTIAQWRKCLNQTNTKHVKVVSIRFKHNTLKTTAESFI